MTPSSLTWGAGGGKDTNQHLLANNDLSTLDLKEEKEFTFCVIIRSHQAMGKLGKAISEAKRGWNRVIPQQPPGGVSGSAYL